MKKKPLGLRAALTAATGALLGAPAAQADDWEFDSALLIYSEPDRVSLLEPVVSARWDRGDDEYMNFKLTVDTLTGSSANGSTPASTVQTFTTPSGRGTYDAAAGETPLDPTFRDTRVAFNYAWDRPLGRLWKLTLGGNVSTEYDYQSAAISAVLARDFNLRNTTLSAGLSLGHDTIDAVGGRPVPLAEMPPEDGLDPTNRQGGTGAKDLTDVLLGLTQVLSPRSLIQVNYSWGKSDGYLTDPYKLVTVVDPAAGPNQGEPVRQLYESRPDARTKQAWYAIYKRQNESGSTWDLSYRYLWDDWGITSHTVDGHFRWNLGGGNYLQPHIRLYRQGPADFYVRYLEDGTPLPAYASADYRLGEFTGTTVGLKWGHQFANGHEFGLHLEWYRQSGDSHPADATGNLRNHDLFPTVDALMLQLNYTF